MNEQTKNFKFERKEVPNIFMGQIGEISLQISELSISFLHAFSLNYR